MKEKSLIEEQRDIFNKYMQGFKLSYYECLVVHAVLISLEREGVS